MKAVRTRGLLITWAAPFVAVLAVPTPVAAFEVSGGVGLGGFLAGTVAYLAISPHAGLSWPIKHEFIFAAHDLCNILLPINNAGTGVFNEASVAIGYSSDNANFSARPSFSIYYMTACGLTLCGRVAGVAVGGHAQTDVYLAGPLGISVSANVEWIGGN